MHHPVVVISGAAGGIGSACVKEFLLQGYQVVGFDIDDRVLADQAGYHGVQLDITDTERLVAALTDLPGPLAHVIGVAGGPIDGETEIMKKTTPEAVHYFEQSMSINLTAQFALAHAGITALRRDQMPHPSIVFISSINALSYYGMPAYSAAKAGIQGLVTTLAGAVGSKGIRVNAVAPGTVVTERIMNDVKRSMHGHDLLALIQKIPLGSAGQPEDIAAVVFHVAHDFFHMNGEMIRVDGGQILKH